jgi:NAD(P)-dependent dehydrogenase (short-subunit alcohol dehydrogenase family)
MGMDRKARKIMKSVNQQTILVTGATDGIGKLTALSLASQQARVLVHGRNKDDADAMRAYCQSKLALVMFTIDLADRLKTDRITVNCLHPGTFLDTNMVRRAGISPLGVPQGGAEAEVHLAVSPAVADTTGKYFDVKTASTADAQAYDAVARQRLWELSLQLTGLAA